MCMNIFISPIAPGGFKTDRQSYHTAFRTADKKRTVIHTNTRKISDNLINHCHDDEAKHLQEIVLKRPPFYPARLNAPV